VCGGLAGVAGWLAGWLAEGKEFRFRLKMKKDKSKMH
jgi:hypothetical protein